jgi:hypothetical protein
MGSKLSGVNTKKELFTNTGTFITEHSEIYARA